MHGESLYSEWFSVGFKLGRIAISLLSNYNPNFDGDIELYSSGTIENLYLDENQLQGIEWNLDMLHLKHLDVSFNKIKKVSLRNMETLEDAQMTAIAVKSAHGVCWDTWCW